MTQVNDEQKRRVDVLFAGGVAWTASAKWVTQLFSWASVFVTARLLSPSDFGISEMASFFYLLTNILAEFGVGTAVLQMQELERGVLAQLHTFSCLICAFAYVLSIPAAPLIASFFQIEHLTSLIVVCNLGFFITGFQAVPLGLLQRDMDYRRLSLADAAQALVQSVVTVTAAWSGLGYWSLVIGVTVGKATAAALVSCWKPIPFAVPRWRDIRAPLRLGGQAAIGRLAWAAYTQADGVTIGRILGKSVLGVYRMAITLASAPADKISALIMRAAGPLFAKVQSDVTQARRYFLILAQALTMIELPLMLGLGVVAPEAVQVVLGSKWAGVVAPLRWLVLFMTLRTLATLMEQVLISKRLTGFTMRMSLLNLFVMPPAFFIAAHWKGTSGVAATWIVLAPVTIFPLVWKVLRAINSNLRELVVELLPAVAGVSAMVGVLLLLRAWLAPQPWPAVFRLTVQVAVGAVVYVAVLMGFFREKVMRYVRFVQDLRKEKEVLARGKL
jgi:O-antigen/teichoic acid export membrane protein